MYTITALGMCSVAVLKHRYGAPAILKVAEAVELPHSPALQACCEKKLATDAATAKQRKIGGTKIVRAAQKTTPLDREVKEERILGLLHKRAATYKDSDQAYMQSNSSSGKRCATNSSKASVRHGLVRCIYGYPYVAVPTTAFPAATLPAVLGDVRRRYLHCMQVSCSKFYTSRQAAQNHIANSKDSPSLIPVVCARTMT